jgi:phage terminase Nu1 subunit (DNA packaging protein)
MTDIAGDLAPRMNLEEMAAHLRITRPTLTAWMKRWPEFPVERRGNGGAPYQFDAGDVVEFVAARRREEDEGKAQHAAALEDFQRGLPLPSGDAPAVTLSPKQQTEALKALLMRHQVDREERRAAQERGELVRAADVREVLANAYVRFSRSLPTAIRSAGREANLPDAVVAKMIRAVESAQREFVRAAAEHLDPDCPAPEAVAAHG